MRAEGGVKWGEFDCETQAFGLATTGGTVADTGIAGLTLGGGHGWLGYKSGLASDNLISIDLVTADGQMRVVSDTEHPDLFWGVRGAGGNFGVVTSLEYRLYPVGPVLAGLVFHPIEKARETLQFYRDFSSATHEELSCYAALMTSPDGAKMVAIGVCYDGPLAEGERSDCASPPVWTAAGRPIRPMAYTELQSMIDLVVPPGTSTTRKPTFYGRSATKPSTSWSITSPASHHPCLYRSSSRPGALCSAGAPPMPTATPSII